MILEGHKVKELYEFLHGLLIVPIMEKLFKKEMVFLLQNRFWRHKRETCELLTGNRFIFL